MNIYTNIHELKSPNKLMFSYSDQLTFIPIYMNLNLTNLCFHTLINEH